MTKYERILYKKDYGQRTKSRLFPLMGELGGNMIFVNDKRAYSSFKHAAGGYFSIKSFVGKVSLVATVRPIGCQLRVGAGYLLTSVVLCLLIPGYPALLIVHAMVNSYLFGLYIDWLYHLLIS